MYINKIIITVINKDIIIITEYLIMISGCLNVFEINSNK